MRGGGGGPPGFSLPPALRDASASPGAASAVPSRRSAPPGLAHRERAHRERSRAGRAVLPPLLRTPNAAWPGSGGGRPSGRRPAESGTAASASWAGSGAIDGGRRAVGVGCPTVVREREGAKRERETPRGGRGPRRFVPSDAVPPRGVRTGDAPRGADPCALRPAARVRDRMTPCPGKPEAVPRRVRRPLRTRRWGRRARSGPPGRRACVPVAATRAEGAVTREPRRRDDGFPAVVGRSATPPAGRGIGGTPCRAAPAPPALGSSPPLAASARRPSVSPLPSRPSFRLSSRPRAGPADGARLPPLSPSGASDRSEGNFRRPEGGRRVAAAAVLTLRASLQRAAGAPPGRGRGRRRRGCRGRGVGLFPRRQFPSPTRGPGTRDVLRGGGSKPRAASPGEAGDRGAPPRLPTSPPAAAGPPERRGPGPSRAPGPVSVETQLCPSCFTYRGGAASSSA